MCIKWFLLSTFDSVFGLQTFKFYRSFKLYFVLDDFGLSTFDCTWTRALLIVTHNINQY